MLSIKSLLKASLLSLAFLYSCSSEEPIAADPVLEVAIPESSNPIFVTPGTPYQLSFTAENAGSIQVSNLPEGWNDEIGGVFQALDGQWYNASNYYVRGHITYEAPFLLLRHLIKYTNHVQNERLYLNLLTMDHLGPYLEVGYGIGTFVFDMGLFLSLEKFNRIGFGYKFTFELFNN